MSDDLDLIVEAVDEKPVNETSKKKPKPQPTQAKKKIRGLNSGTFSGVIEKAELKKSGSFELYVNTDQTRKDTPIKGSVFPKHFTSTIFVRIPKPIVDRVGKESFSEGCHIILPYRLVGVRNVIDGKPYDIVEVQAKDAIFAESVPKAS